MSDHPQNRVLVIDDDAGICEVLRLSLEETGRYTVATELDPAIALITASSHRPDLFVVDLNMPHLNGFELASALREDPDFRERPMIFFSGVRPENLDRRIQSLGGNAIFLSKRTSITDLIAAADCLCRA